MTKASSAMSKAGNATAGNVSKAVGNLTKGASNAASKAGQVIGGGLKSLGNLISGGKPDVDLVTNISRAAGSVVNQAFFLTLIVEEDRVAV